MVHLCAMVGCGNRSNRDRNVSFYRLPSIRASSKQAIRDVSERRREWLSAINRSDIPASSYEHVRVCSRHFILGKPAELADMANPDWIPTLRLGYERPEVGLARYNREVARDKTRMKQAENDLETSPEPEPEPEKCQEMDVEEPSAKLPRIESSLKKAESTLSMVLLTEEGFCGNDKKTAFYTGLPSWLMFSVVLSFMESHLYSRCLNPFQQLLMTFIRLRHNFPFDDIAYRFGVHTSTCSRLFATTISAMYRQLIHLVSWPDRDVLRRTLPMSFVKHSPHCTVIIDCFEIFIDRPVNMLARAQTYSSYKKHNTAKYLIGISPPRVPLSSFPPDGEVELAISG